MNPFKKSNSFLEEQISSDENNNKLLIDFSQLVIVSITGTFKTEEEQENLTSHQFKSVVLGSLKDIVKKYKSNYPEVIICADNASIPYYKRSFAPYYKAHRAEGRKDSKLNWEMIFTEMRSLLSELENNFPYKVVYIPGLEADDIIGYLATEGNSGKYKSMIISADGDFTQLHSKYTKQWSPMHQKLVQPKISSFGDLVVKIIKGDTKDSVSPMKVQNTHAYNNNMKQSELNEVKRAPSTKQEELDLYIKTGSLEELRKIIPEEYLMRFDENVKLLDLSILPDEYKQKIDDILLVIPKANRSILYSYFMKNNLTKLLESIQDF